VSHIQGDASTKLIGASSWKGNAISFTIRNPADASDTDLLLFTLKDPPHAQIQREGSMFPFELVFAGAKATIGTDWDRPYVVLRRGVRSNTYPKSVVATMFKTVAEM